MTLAAFARLQRTSAAEGDAVSARNFALPQLVATEAVIDRVKNSGPLVRRPLYQGAGTTQHAEGESRRRIGEVATRKLKYGGCTCHKYYNSILG
jgi:hypothetical protein